MPNISGNSTWAAGDSITVAKLENMQNNLSQAQATTSSSTSATNGWLEVRTDTNDLRYYSGGSWRSAGIKTYRVPHTWAIPGEIKVASSETDYIVPMFIGLGAGQTASIVAARHRLNKGTSVTASIQKNSSDITGFTSISVTTSNGLTDPANVALSDGDLLALVVGSVSTDSPKNMTFTVLLEYTV